ncbi:MAG: hypothetical protein ACMXYF_03865 [Candidatus Woesearchaeota archaeon]
MKAQVAIFMVVGIVLVLLSVLTYVYFTSAQDDWRETPVSEPLTAIEIFIDACIQSTARSGLQLLGTQGGLITVPDPIRLNPSRSVSFDPVRNIVTPIYGEYELSREVVEEGLGEFITQNIGTCLNNFDAFEHIETIESFERPQAQVSVNDNDITILLEYRINRREQLLVSEQDQFISRLDIQLADMINAANHLFPLLREQDFFEDMTINLISAADHEDPQFAVPVTGISFSCTPPTWFKPQVHQNIQNILTASIPNIRVEGATDRTYLAADSVYERLAQTRPDDLRRPGLPDAPADSYEYQHLQVRDSYDYNNLQVAMRYLPDYGLDMQVRPSSGNRMHGSLARGERNFLRFFCMQTYHFTYDLHYPVEVAFIQTEAFGGAPFVLRIATTANIVSNQPASSQAGYNVPTDMIRDTVFCEDTSAGKIYFIALDAQTQFPIEEATVDYECYNRRCDLGVTQAQSGDNAYLRTSIPRGCAGAYVTMEAPGYLPSRQYIEQAPMTGTQTREFYLTPLVEIPISIYVGMNLQEANAQPLADNQRAIIHIEDVYSSYDTYVTVQNRGRDRNYEQTRIVDTNISLPKRGSTYNVTMLLYENNEWIGGWINQVRVTPEQLDRRLRIHAYQFISDGLQERTTIEKWTKLDTGFFNQSDIREIDYREWHEYEWI